MGVGLLKETWNTLGRTDPLWAVLTEPGARHGRWDPDRFFATGEHAIAEVVELLRRNGCALGQKVLDFGCGVGRLSNALALHADVVVGVDIAESMVAEASRLNRRGDKIRFVSYDGRVLPFADGTFDSAVSLIVLQHAPPAVQLQNLLELQRVVRPGGVIVLQAPQAPRRPEPLPAAACRAKIEVLSVPARLAPGQAGKVRARVTNPTARPWPKDRLIKLANHWRAGELSVHDDGRADLPGPLAPGASVELELPVRAPPVHGRASLELDIVQEFVAWWAERGSAAVSTEIEISAEPAIANGASGSSPGSDVPQEAKDEDRGMEMHGLPGNVIETVLGHCGATVVDRIADGWAGPVWESFTYLIRVRC